MVAGHSFLFDQLDLSNITLEKCWFGTGDTLFVRFLSFSEKLRVLRAKRKLFSLSSNIYLDEDLTKAQVIELKQAWGIVTGARRAGK